jgi:hypothetical protein
VARAQRGDNEHQRRSAPHPSPKGAPDEAAA